MNWTAVILLSCLAGITSGWTYHYSDTTMNWAEAREWCRSKYTDMVVIQNQMENDYLISLLPKRASSPYFWIGITKNHINEPWRWIGNNSTWVGNKSWAENEPNNNHSTEFCVEIYTSTGSNRGRWNDEKCDLKKYATCYKAQCTNTSCDRGRCHETINNFTCLCEPGFVGDQCQTAVECDPVSDPDNGALNCTARNHTFNTTCRVTCFFGFLGVRSSHITCQTNGLWSGPRPTCASYKHALMAVVGSGAVSTLCCICLCWMKHRKRKKIAQERQPDEVTTLSSG